MADVEVGARLKVDAGNSGKTIQDLKNNLKEARKELNETTLGSKEYEEALKKVDKAEQALNPSIKDKASSFSLLKEKITSTVPALGGATSAGTAFNGVLNLLKANPLIFLLTAIVVVLKGLYEAFASTFEGGQKVEQIFSGIKAAGQVLMDRLVQLSGAIVKLFSGDFKGAMNDAKASVTGLGDEVGRVYSKTAELTKQLQGIKIEERNSNVDQAEREKRLALLREQLNDENISLKAKKEIALQLKKDVDENYADDLKRDRKKAEIQIELLKQQKDGERKNAEEIAQIRIGLANAETANALEGVRVNKQIRALERQEAAEDKAARDKATAEQKAQKQELVEFTNRLYKMRQDNELAILAEGVNKEKQIAANSLEDKKRDIAVSVASRKISSDQANQLLIEATKAYNIELSKINEKFNKEEATKKVAFEKELASVVKDIRIASITDIREKEKQILLEELRGKTAEVLANEKYTFDQRALLIAQLAKQAEIKQAQLDEKYKLEDRQKANKELLATLKTDTDIAIAIGGNKLALQRDYLEKSRALEREDLILKKATLAELTDFDNQTALSRINLSKAERDEKVNNAMTVANTLTSISSLVGEQTVVGKGLAAAAAVINTYQGATKALAQGGIFGYIGAAGVIAAGLSSVRKILTTPVPGKGSSGAGSVSASATPVAPPTPQVATTALDPNSIQQIGNATNRAFVIERDVTNNQERVERLNRAARIG